MIRVKILPRNEVAIIENGKVVLFNNVGRCIQEDAGFVGKYMTGSLDLPIISLLSSNGVLDVAMFEEGQEMKRFKSSLDSMQCAMKLQMQGGFIRMLRRDGEQDGIRYNQLLFIYKENTNLEEILQCLEVKEAQ